MAETVPIRRCAIYVRKSSEEGLDMSYNSLEAQTDACTAYIASQRHEGWTKLPKVYEDGGFSGGNLDRPGLQELLGDIGKGQIDIILVYKIDRLTRSLTDFAKLNDLLDKHMVSFVAVTQQFNTSTSMGRLTLNVLLSFAQFEREVAGERIRDKFAASKKKGIWMGGMIPLGYRVEKRQLHVVPEEADVVRHIFRRYRELKSVQRLQQELEQDGVRSKVRESKNGTPKGGMVITRGAARHMLKNPLYLGLIRHGKELHQGQHVAIVDTELFQEVQQTLTDLSPGDVARTSRARSALLKGLLFDSNGERLQPTHAVKRGVRYHYYTSARMLRDAKNAPQGIRVPAGDVERLVCSAVVARLRDSGTLQPWLASKAPTGGLPRLLKSAISLADTLAIRNPTNEKRLRSLILKVVVSKQMIRIHLSENGLAETLEVGQNEPTGGQLMTAKQMGASADESRTKQVEEALKITITSQLLRCGRQVKLILGNHDNEAPASNAKLVEMVVQGRHWFAALSSGAKTSVADVAEGAGYDRTYVSRQITLAFLAPDIVESILTGTHSPLLTPERLRKACPLPQKWDEQRAMLLA